MLACTLIINACDKPKKSKFDRKKTDLRFVFSNPNYPRAYEIVLEFFSVVIKGILYTKNLPRPILSIYDIIELGFLYNGHLVST